VIVTLCAWSLVLGLSSRNASLLAIPKYPQGDIQIQRTRAQRSGKSPVYPRQIQKSVQQSKEPMSRGKAGCRNPKGDEKHAAYPKDLE
jgi:hypothetical protein